MWVIGRFTGCLLLGALAWLVGSVLWALDRSVPDVAGWWLSFLVLTIAGERLELSRLMPSKRGSEVWFLLAVGLLIVGAQNGPTTAKGSVPFGLALLAFAGWLFRHDIARRGIRLPGQPRYMAIAMLSGYLWLGTAGLILIAPQSGPFGYDAALHAITIGFVLSMVFAQALIILPALAGLRVSYRPCMYAPLALLHTSLVLRVVGDLFSWTLLRSWSGPATLVALACYAITMAASRLRQGPNANATP